MQPPQNPESSNPASAAPGDGGALARIESNLKERRAEMTRLMAEMRDLYHAGKSQAQLEIEGLRQEKLQFQQQLEKRGQDLAALGEQLRSAQAHTKGVEQHYQQVLAEAEAALTEQGAEIGRLVAEFRESKVENPEYYVPPPPSQAEIATLTPQALLRELVKASRASDSSQAEVATLPPQTARELVELTQKLAERDEEVKLLRAELVERDQLIQEFHAQQYAARLAASTQPAELEKVRGELERVRQQLTEANSKLAARPTMVSIQEVEKLRDELTSTRQQLTEANRKVTAMNAMVPMGELDEDRRELGRAREELATLQHEAEATANRVPAVEADELRRELARALEQLQEEKNKSASAQALAAPPPATAEISSLQKELTRLKAELAEKEEAIQISVPAGDVEKLIGELGRARGEIAKLHQQTSISSNAGELEQLKAELIILQEEMHEKDRRLIEKEATAGGAAPADKARIAQYEAELIRYHRQLEVERESLGGSLRELEQRNAELALAAQKAQHDLSHERAQLHQLRDELHIDLAFEDLAFLARKHLAPIQPAKKK